MSIAIDGHVHIYPNFSVSRFFDAAWENFSKLNTAHGLTVEPDCALFLTEGGENAIFEALAQRADSYASESTNKLRFQKTEEPDSLIAEKNGRYIYVFAGRQHISAENIEVLSLFSRKQITDRSLPLSELAHNIAGSDGVVVVPWGVGKWFGSRGKVVEAFLNSAHEFPMFIGDNGNRPLFWPTPSLFRVAHKKRVPLLSGSDPLPLASHDNRVATSGTLLLNGKISKSHPAASLRKQLNQVENLREFGNRLNPVRFIYDQLHINLLNRLK